MSDVAERTAACAKLTHDHERRRAFAEALADVRAGCFFANGVQIVLAQDALDVVEARRGWRSRPYPRGLLQSLRGDHLDGDARGLGAAFMLDPGRRRRRRAGLLRQRDNIAHRVFRSTSAIAWVKWPTRRSSISARDACTSRSRNCVTASPR